MWKGISRALLKQEDEQSSNDQIQSRLLLLLLGFPFLFSRQTMRRRSFTNGITNRLEREKKKIRDEEETEDTLNLNNLSNDTKPMYRDKRRWMYSK